MSNDLNRCEFIGRLGKDPEIRYMKSGDPVANFSIACGEKYTKKNGEKVENTEWINLVAYRGLAKVIGDFLSKGSQVYVSGKYHTQKWQDKNNNDRWSTQVVIDNMQMLGSKGDSSTPTNVDSKTVSHAASGDFDSDIPFAPIPFICS